MLMLSRQQYIRHRLENLNIGVPKSYSLSQNYPNPFNPVTKINYAIPKDGLVKIRIYDILGREIIKLVNEEKPAGTYELTWNAENLPSGIFFYQLRTNSFIENKKMILLR